MANKNYSKYLFELSIIILAYWGAHAWFTWQWTLLDNFGSLFVYIVFSLIAYIYKTKYGVHIHMSPPIVVSALFLLGASSFPKFGVTTIPSLIFRYYPLLVFLSDKDHFHEHFRLFNRITACLLIPGMLLHLVFFVGVEFPGWPIQFGDLDVNFSYIFFNYGVLLRGLSDVAENVRFQSVFLEPGYLGTLLAFLLYANKYDFKQWYNKVFAVALILTFSLAGYITSIAGYTFFLFLHGRSIGKFTIGLLFILAIFYGAQSYNGGNNVVNELIVNRLQFDQELGISGNNRFSDKTRDYYDYYMSRGGLWTGATNVSDVTDISGAGYMRFFITNGIIAAIFYLLFYLCLARSSYNRRYGNGFVLLVVLTFLQAAYPSSFSWLIPFIMTLNNGEYEK